ncbi:MAG TPA: Rrf2 family transcriptional regulator [Candidatus Omnitrophica bacterium]|nr:Rrf2 family transcriptional regulator [Candidatus Omnitrophota bacterium]
MNLINRDTDYAIRALCFIAQHKKERLAVSDLVKALKIPQPFLRKILQKLNKNGLLISYKGQGGGFSLARIPRKILISHLIKIFQGSLRLNECFFKKQRCPETNDCSLKKRVDIIEKHVISELESISIASLMRKGRD